MIRTIAFAVILLFSVGCMAQNFKLDKESKNILKNLQKEGWKTLDESSNLESQFIAWHQLEKESGDRYIFSVSECESTMLKIAERRAWDDACTQIRSSEQLKVTGTVVSDESSSIREDGSTESHSDVISNQRMKISYTSNNNDLRKIFAIYKQDGKTYKVKMVVVKERK